MQTGDIVDIELQKELKKYKINVEKGLENHGEEYEEKLRQFIGGYDFMRLGQTVNHERWESAMMSIRRMSMQAESLGLEKRYWGRLQKGETIELDDKIYTPDMVMGGARKGLKVTYCTDTRPTESIVNHATNADLFICEGMYGEPEKKAKAREYKHMTFYEAAEMAKRAQVEQMWLTHYSPSLIRPEEFMKDVKAIFQNSKAAKDGMTIELKFEEEK